MGEFDSVDAWSTFDPGENAVELAYKQSLCQAECVELCFQGVEDPECSVFPANTAAAKCTCSW